MEPIDHHDPSNAAVKPSWKTGEFWLTAAANLIGLLLIVLPLVLKPGEQTEQIMQIIGGCAIVLGNLGYTVPRQMHKSTVAEGAAAIAIERIRSEAANPSAAAAAVQR